MPDIRSVPTCVTTGEEDGVTRLDVIIAGDVTTLNVVFATNDVFVTNRDNIFDTRCDVSKVFSDVCVTELDVPTSNALKSAFNDIFMN